MAVVFRTCSGDAGCGRPKALEHRELQALIRTRGAGLPERLGTGRVRRPRQDEEQGGEPVHIRGRLRVQRLGRRQRDDLALGPPADRAADVELRRGGRAAGQDERGQRRELLVHLVAPRLEPRHLRGVDPQARPLALRRPVGPLLLRHAEVGAEIEQLVLDPRQPGVPAIGQGQRPQDPDLGVQLVDRAVGGDPRARLGDAPAVAEAGLAGVAAARVDARQVDHARSMPRTARARSIPPRAVRQYADHDEGGDMQYLLLIYGDEAHWDGLSEDESQAIFDEYRTYSESISAQGIMQGGAALRPVATARTVRVRDGRATVSDGPFAETREQLGGYYLVECESEQEALDAAARIPKARFGCVEVRPLLQMPAPTT